MNQIVIITPGKCEVRDDDYPPALTPTSRQHALKIQDEIRTAFDGAYFIPGPGAAQTAHLIAGQEMKDVPQEVLPPPNLVRNPNYKVLQIAQEQFGTNTLSDYLRHDLEIPLTFAAHEYCHAMGQLTRAAQHVNVLLVADPVMTPMLATILSPHTPKDEFIRRTLGYHEGYRFTLKKEGGPYWDAEPIGFTC